MSRNCLLRLSKTGIYNVHAFNALGAPLYMFSPCIMLLLRPWQGISFSWLSRFAPEAGGDREVAPGQRI